MRRVLALILILGLAGAGSAEEIYLFWSTTGISDPNLRYSTARTDFQPAYQAPTPVFPELPAGTYDLYLWGQFPVGWENYQIYGLDLKWGPGNTAQHTENVVYRHKWGNLPSEQRWDGSVSIPLDGAMNANAADGIIWDTVTPAYHLMEPNGMFLIGAARITGDPSEMAGMSLDAPPLGQGIHVRDANGNEVSPTPSVLPAYVSFYLIPEPGAALLLFTAISLGAWKARNARS